jgi:hypothetical protein
MNYKNSDNFCSQQFKKTLELIEERGHTYVDGNYKTKESKLLVYCPFHDEFLETTFTNYKRSKTGCKYCGRDKVSEALTGRVFDDETIELMRTSANNRPLRGGKPRRWRETTGYRNFRKDVMKYWNNECAITGYKNKEEEQRLIVHHLISAKSNEKLVLNPLNGIVIQDYLHKKFHKNFGYQNNDFQQFRTFLLQLIQGEKTLGKKDNTISAISSQEEVENSYGSETKKFYNHNKIMELHELLGEIEKKLIADEN